MVVKVVRRLDNNKQRKSILPLFSGYLSFAGAAETHRQLYATGRIASIIEIRNQKKFIADLGQIYQLLEKGVPLEPYQFAYTEGDEVRVLAGPCGASAGPSRTCGTRKSSCSRSNAWAGP